MKKYICTTCGVQYESLLKEPENCLICSDERQYINPNGQSWTTLDDMQKESKFVNKVVCEEDGLYSITTEPTFAIGQTAFLVKGNNFNILWDCISYLDEETIKELNEIGGVHAIALSHPHFYSTQVEWAELLNIPIYIHEDDREWVMRPSEHIIFWSGVVLDLHEGIKIHRLGGHFKGSSVLEWQNGNNGKGILLTGDTIHVVADSKWVSFMYSYPNLIPLPASKVKEIAESVNEFKFDRLYNAFQRVVKEDAKASVLRSAIRYIAAIDEKLTNT